MSTVVRIGSLCLTTKASIDNLSNGIRIYGDKAALDQISRRKDKKVDLTVTGSSNLREPANKSNAFSAVYRTARCEEDSAVKCLDLFKLTDKAGGRYRARPLGLSERPDLSVNDFRRTTSMPVIAVLTSDLSESQRHMGLVRRFLRQRLKL